MKNIAVIASVSEQWRTFENTHQCDLVFEKLKELLKGYSEEGICLITSLNLGVETIAAIAALRLREERDIMLECVIPYEERANDWSEPDRDRYFYILEKCDKETLIQTGFSPDAEQKALEYIINSADEIVTFGELPLKAGVIASELFKKVIKL